MADREKVIKGLECCSETDMCCMEISCYHPKYLECPYHEIENCVPNLVKDALALLKEQEEREKRICKEICDIIRGTCSTDTDDDKDFVCYEIQKRFMEGRCILK